MDSPNQPNEQPIEPQVSMPQDASHYFVGNQDTGYWNLDGKNYLK